MQTSFSPPQGEEATLYPPGSRHLAAFPVILTFFTRTRKTKSLSLGEIDFIKILKILKKKRSEMDCLREIPQSTFPPFVISLTRAIAHFSSGFSYFPAPFFISSFGPSHLVPRPSLSLVLLCPPVLQQGVLLQHLPAPVHFNRLQSSAELLCVWHMTI